MTQQNDPEFLNAAECAWRTGLTVRALRVYERAGLIHPTRSAKGWRRYGPEELSRLNSIVILKALGFTLTQIRSVLAEHPPSLLSILEIHEKQWQARRETAERALTLVSVARSRLQADQTLSVDELCQLIKGVESNKAPTMKTQTALLRDLINKNTTPDEERAWNTWWAEHPDDVEMNLAFVKEQNELFAELPALAAAGAAPGSPEVQSVVARHKDLLTRYQVRERAIRQLEWNRDVTLRFWSMGARARKLDDSNAVSWRARKTDNPDVVGAGARQADDPGAVSAQSELFLAGIREAPWTQALAALLRDVAHVTDALIHPPSPDADEVVARLREICREHALGDPYIHTQWGPFIARINRPDLSEGSYDTQWDFLAKALLARSTVPQ